MNLIRKTYDTTEVQITSFQSSKGITEYHIFFQQTNCLEDFHTQLQHIQDVYAHSVEELPGNPVAIFRRYFLSDVTNQTDELMERERLSPYCALSIVQQAPMNGTKIALWAWLQTGVQTQVLPNGLFEARHGAYGQLLGANQCNRAANSEYQTRLIFRDYILQLTEANCTLAANCLRTWIFVQNVDVNYPGVVKARKEVFATQNLTEETHFIASTGIEGRYFDPMVFVTMDTYAVSGICPGQIRYLYAPEHLNRTYEYGVTFERGTAVNQTDELMERERLSPYCALSIVQQAPMNGTKIALWAWLQTGVQTQVLPNGLFEARHGAYGQLLGANQCNRAANSEYQTRLIFRDYILQLTEANCTLAANCLRTWIFVQNVDVNYPGVVKARKEVFATQNLTEETHFIASTGIEGRYFDPMVFVTMDTYAVSGICPGQIRYLYAPEHLNRTYEYGVTFERGTAVTYGDRRHVFISGTASIDRYGEIVHAGDVIKQTSRMIENIEALLKEADATLNDIMQAVIYIRDTADYARVKRYIDEHHPSLPYIIVRAPVCRTGWLVEMECTAVTAKGDERFAAL